MKDFSRRQFIGRTTLAAAPLILLPGIAKSWTGSTIDYQTVETQYGKLRGYRENGVTIYKGVPYAGDVSGVNRFQKAGPVLPWTGVRDALQLGNPSIQPPNQTYGINEPDPAEDCLVLNIWTPANDGKKRPVMVYNHGGGYRTGSGGSASQDGANLARMYDVVVVATNHRLGLMGFLYLDELGGEQYKGSGNRGVQDIAVALKWINENIEQFGGNPENVMIFGESGGGFKTSCLYAMPEAATYFNKASIESGPSLEIGSAEAAAKTTRLLLEYLNISPSNWEKLLDIPVEKLLEAQSGLSQWAASRIESQGVAGFRPVLDNVVMIAHPFSPEAPEISKNKPLQVGWNEDEYLFFAMSGDKNVLGISDKELQNRLDRDYNDNSKLIYETYKNATPDATPGQIYVAIRSITMMGLGSVKIAERKTQQGGAPVYLYNFGYKSNNKIPGTEFETGAMHALDIPFKFYNVESGMAGNKPDRFTASKNMTSFWTSFARTGKPEADGQPEWPAYNLVTRPTMRIDSSCKVINDRYSKELKMWDSIK